MFRVGTRVGPTIADMSEEPPVLVTKSDGVATVMLNRPDVYNSFNPEMTEQLASLFDKDPRGRARMVGIRKAS